MKQGITGILFALLPVLSAGACKGIEAGTPSIPLFIALAAIMLILCGIGKTKP